MAVGMMRVLLLFGVGLASAVSTTHHVDVQKCRRTELQQSKLEHYSLGVELVAYLQAL